MQKENWDDLRIVLAVSRASSFARAARLLFVNESTVVRRVAQTEERLGARLFERKHGTLLPTEAGKALIYRAETVEGVVLDATSSIRGSDSQVAGTVRLTSVPILVNRVLIPGLPRLVSQHPHLQVEFLAEARLQSLAKGEVDLALRLTRPLEGARAVTRKVGELPYAVYAPKGADASRLPWVTYERGTGLPQSGWMASQAGARSEGSGVVRVNDAESLMACLHAGLGKTLLPIAIGERTPGLVRLREVPCDVVRELWLVVHADLRRLERVRVVKEWVIATCAELTGQCFPHKDVYEEL